MPQYFFDFDDGETHVRDQVGIELPDLDAVEREAMSTLYDVVHARMPVGRHLLVVKVRNALNVYVYRGEMTVNGQRF